MLSPSWCMRSPATKVSSPQPKLPPKTKKTAKKNNDKRKSPKLTTEPSSPRVGCMGQIKSQLHSSSPSSSSSSSSSSPSSFRGKFDLLLIKRFVSSKILIKEMDPPRPVEKKERREESSVSLWKRRCVGGDSLKLKLQSLEQVSA